jgi:hypothetical protein
MTDHVIPIVKLITDNPLVSAILGGCIVALIIWAISTLKDARETKRIYEFLRQSTQNGEYTFRSTQAISAATYIPESRVGSLCSNERLSALFAFPYARIATWPRLR